MSNKFGLALQQSVLNSVFLLPW